MPQFKSKIVNLNGVNYNVAIISVNKNEGDFVDLRYDNSAKSYDDFVATAPIKKGKKLFGFINGGAFDGYGKPYGTCVINGSTVQSDLEFLNDSVNDVAIVDKEILIDNISESSDRLRYKLLRGGYDFSLTKKNNIWEVTMRTYGGNIDMIFTRASARTLVAFSDKEAFFIVIKNAIQGALIGKLIDQIDTEIVDIVNMDGGASASYYLASDNSGWKPNRLLHEVFYIYEDESDNPEVPTIENVKMRLTNSAARLREDVVNGTIKTTIPNGSIFDVIGLYSWKASDGYRWGWGKYGTVEGYFQYDAEVMNLLGKPKDNFIMNAEYTEVNLCSDICGNTIIKIPVGTSINVIDFIDKKQTDGYFWCKGKYADIIGYFKYESVLMYPTTDGIFPPIDPQPPVDPEPIKQFEMYVTKLGANLREDVVSGNIRTTVPSGENFEILGLYGWTAHDGYRWGWGKYKGIEGTFQYDSDVMHPAGVPNDEKYKMVLVSSSARVRSSIGGEIITTVLKGCQIKITEFLSQKHSDGYYWCKGEYEGYKGYFQYDPKVMYPTND